MSSLLNKIRTSKTATLILNRLGGPERGLGKLSVKLLYNHYKMHPTREMMKSRSFFTANAERINNIMDILSDEKSKHVFDSMIKFRMTMDYNIHPGMELPQYFTDIIKLNANEVFVDVGGYDGGTSAEFIKHTCGKFKSIIIFEPDNKCIDMIKANPDLKPYENIQIIPKGGWNCDTTLKFVMSSDSASKIVDTDVNINGKSNDISSNIVEIPVTSIDASSECHDATFIKMDIEGAEWEALHGAKDTIVRNRPKLAICIYHSDDDMLRLIEYVHELVPEYRIYVRHHSTGTIETVAYFV